METQIRPMQPGDYPDMLALWNRIPGMGLNPIDDAEDGVARFLHRNPTSCFVALDGGALVGTILAGHDGRRGFIYHACVEETCRGRHIGKALVHKALNALRAEGIIKVCLVCFKDNSTGNGFWAHNGWQLREDLNYFQMPLKMV